MRLHSGLCVISALWWDVIVTNCFFVCICLFVCYCLFVFGCGHICVFCGYRLWCVTESVTRTRRDWCSRNLWQSLIWTQLVTKFTSFLIVKKTSYQIFFPNLGFCEDLFFANQCQVVVSQWQKHKQIKSRNFQTVKGDVCNHASISIQILLCLARAV